MPKKKVIAKAKKKNTDAEAMKEIQKKYDYANAIFEIQDENTKAIIRHLEGKAQEMGRNQNEAGRMLSRYVVIRLLIACAKWISGSGNSNFARANAPGSCSSSRRLASRI